MPLSRLFNTGNRKLLTTTYTLQIICFSTQLPQAVGVAYSLKMDKKDACAVTYTGDGGTSEVPAVLSLIVNGGFTCP